MSQEPSFPLPLPAELQAAFAQVQDGDQMLEFWRGAPAELEEPFMQAVGGLIAQAEAAAPEASARSQSAIAPTGADV